MLGCSSRAVAVASARNRCKSDSLASRPRRIILTATIAIETDLPGTKHNPHAAATEFFDQFVVADRRGELQASPSTGRRRSTKPLVDHRTGGIGHQDRSPQPTQFVGQVRSARRKSSRSQRSRRGRPRRRRPTGCWPTADHDPQSPRCWISVTARSRRSRQPDALRAIREAVAARGGNACSPQVDSASSTSAISRFDRCS